MMNKSCRLMLMALLAFTLLLPLASWLMAAFGVPVRTLMSDEGLRWFFSQSLDAAFSPAAKRCILLLLVLGSLQHLRASKSNGRNAVRAWVISAILIICMMASLFLLALSHASPLLSVGGQLWPRSPFLTGFPVVCCLGALVVITIHAYVCGACHSLRDIMTLLTAGFTRYGGWMLLVLLVSFDFYALKYMLQ